MAKQRPARIAVVLAAASVLCVPLGLGRRGRGGSAGAFAGGGLRGTRAAGRTGRPSSVSSPSWMEVSEGPTLAPAKDATVMPVYPLGTIEWPGNTVELKVNDTAHLRMYQELLEAGRRRLVAPLSRGAAGAAGPSRAEGDSEGAAERRLNSVAPVLQLEDLKVIGAGTGAVTYVAKHTVVGRARIARLLNPSALFETDASGAFVSYLQAEVDVLQDPSAEVVQTATAKQLTASLEELRALCERLEEPRLQSAAVIKQSVFLSSTWQLLDLWQRLQVASRTYRYRAHAHGVLRGWIEGQQSAGRLPTPLPRQINLAQLGAPAPVVEAFLTAQDPKGLDLGGGFWDRLLGILAVDKAEQRWQLLLEWTQEEVSLALARASLRDTLG